ncbi:MAG: GGDEF domain-containing protein [Firmicutes bacterium]|nr:GGDEF domain-containing protein [Bacillota bacterium]
MLNVVIGTDIFSSIVLFILVISHVGTGTSRSKRDTYFFGLAFTLLVGCVSDVFSYMLDVPYLPVFYQVMFYVFCALCYISEFLTSMFFVLYVFEISDLPENRFVSFKRIVCFFCSASCIGFFIAMLVVLFTGGSYDALEESAVLSVCSVFEILLVLLLFVSLFIIKPHIDIKYWFAASAIPLGLVINIPLLIIVPSFDIGFSIGCMTLLITYLAIQTDESSRYYKTISSLTHIYKSLHLVNLAEGELIELSADDRIHRIDIKDENKSIQMRLWHIMDVVVSQAHREILREFTDISTLEERLKGKTHINVEAINDAGEWWSFGIVRMGEIDEPLKEILFTTEYIDDSKRREEALLRMSHTDRLTGLYNIHAYEENIQEYNKGGLGDNTWYLMIDLNGLKSINDEFGHHAGNEVISAVGTILALSVGEGGQVYRLGGDEFAIVISADSESVDALLESIQNKTDDWNSNHPQYISYSIGVVSSGELPSPTFRDLSEEADRRMYARKQEYYQDNTRR